MTTSEKSPAGRVLHFLPYAVLVSSVLGIIGVALAVMLNGKLNTILKYAEYNSALLEGRHAEIVSINNELSLRLGQLEGKMDFILEELRNKVDKPS